MKLLFIAYFSSSIFYMAYLFWGSANGQSFENSNTYFKKFEFDMFNRGSFNISNCLKDLMTCYELVKGDVICQDFRYLDTICLNTHYVCHDELGDYDSYTFRWSAMEAYCQHYSWT